MDRDAFRRRWIEFEPFLESGRGGLTELEWVRAIAPRVTADDLERIEADWDLDRRVALLEPPASTIATLTALRELGLKVGVLSNTHALELRAWPRSPLAALVDDVALSHEIGVCKPEPRAYALILERLGVAPARAAYVGDGGSNELDGARAAGFGLVVLAEAAAAEHAPGDLPRLRKQADVSVAELTEVVALVAS
ncbi:HAD-IA family hydrolase [Actinoplanes sp. LDG1-01]|uniref:HAD-IA family hydrolase n=2 Tax=Paractinoplanes lichenicola TaxID=2802976 RepID=A0ABS1VXS2_9ACTN|nr:HAD-IA family hydrolase [Actinoplanes lichenicola]MBL7259295.1 HAD-IA family hydrolase [Actinoplanes lichenicola]